jgi:hypothetical protein
LAPIIITIYQIAQLLGAVIVPDIIAALKIKAAFQSLGPDYKVNIQVLGDAAALANKETIDNVNAWLTANGFEPLPPDATLAT